MEVVISHDRDWQAAIFKVDGRVVAVAGSQLRFTKLEVTAGPHVLTALLGTKECSARFSAPRTSPVLLVCSY